MRKTLTMAALVGMTSVAAHAQQSPGLLSAVPGAENAGSFCFYAGLAYSQNALLTVDVPMRRDSPQAVQKRLMRCETQDGSPTMIWVDFNIEQGARAN